MGFGLQLGSHLLSASSLCVEALLKGMDFVVSLTSDGMLQAVWLHPGIVIIALTGWMAVQFRGLTRYFWHALFLALSTVNPKAPKFISK